MDNLNEEPAEAEASAALDETANLPNTPLSVIDLADQLLTREASILASLPTDLRAGYPERAAIQDRTLWLAGQALKFAQRPAPAVPPTDTKPPVVTAPQPDLSGLSSLAKIARGYRA